MFVLYLRLCLMLKNVAQEKRDSPLFHLFLDPQVLRLAPVHTGIPYTSAARLSLQNGRKITPYKAARRRVWPVEAEPFQWSSRVIVRIFGIFMENPPILE